MFSFSFCNITRMTKYFFTWALTQFWLCMALPNGAQKEQSTKDEPWEHHSSSADTDNGKIIYIIICIVIGVIVLLIRCCLKYGCENEEDKYSDAVTHPPPVRYPPPAARYPPPTTALAPPSARSTMLIIPSDFTQGSSAYGGINNSDFRQGSNTYGGIDNPDFRQGSSAYSGIDNPIPPRPQSDMSDMSDFPPSYDSVLKSDLKFPKVSG